MSIRRIAVLLYKELKYSSKSYFYIFAIVAPLSGTLLLNLVFGSIFSEKPKLGIYNESNSQIVKPLKNMGSIDLKEYFSEIELKDAVEAGSQDIGVFLQGSTKLTVYVGGESLLKNRIIAGSALLHQIRDISGNKAPVDITPVSLGKKNNVPWKDRFLPAIVLMAIFVSGFAVPSSSLVDEKQKRTIKALLATPVTQIDIFVSKGLLGIITSIVMGSLILILNHAFNAQMGLIIFILFLGAVMAACFGLILGAFMKEISSVYAAIEGLGVIIYGPGILALFPQAPKWIAKLFPTYYVINPIMEITREGGNWSNVRADVFILIGIIAVFFAIVAVTASKTRQQEA
jgi:ABC-2 type transport system permease protein